MAQASTLDTKHSNTLYVIAADTGLAVLHMTQGQIEAKVVLYKNRSPNFNRTLTAFSVGRSTAAANVAFADVTEALSECLPRELPYEGVVTVVPVGPVRLTPLASALQVCTGAAARVSGGTAVQHAQAKAAEALSALALGRHLTFAILTAPGSDLPFADLESSWLALSLGARGSLMPVGVKLTDASLKELRESPDILHLALHSTQEGLHGGIAANVGADFIKMGAPSLDLLTTVARTRLAFLNVCRFGDESRVGTTAPLGPVASLLHAGVPSVVAPSWAVDDLAGLLFAVRFYGALGVSNGPWRDGDVPQAVEQARTFLRESSKADIESLFLDIAASVPHFGRTDRDAAVHRIRSSGERPFAEPYYWAAWQSFGT